MAVYKSYENCAIVNNGCDVGTFYLPVRSSDGRSVPLNIYVMDSNNKASGEGLLTGYSENYIKVYAAGGEELLNSFQKVTLLEEYKDGMKGELING